MSKPKLIHLNDNPYLFPSIVNALDNPNGLLALGGDLSIERLYAAYQKGIFPWFSHDDPYLWWCPDPRAVLFCHKFHCSRSMQRFHRHSPYRVTLNFAFEQVIKGCAEQRSEGTWITEQVITSWVNLAKTGLAHSVEVWLDERLVGGLYGMAIGQVFCGESMFSREKNASKTALMVFNQHFQYHGGQLIDCQILNAHTASLGAENIKRNVYLQQLGFFKYQSLRKDCWLPRRIF